MGLLYLFEKIRNPVFDFFFSAVTALGEETAFLVIAILVFWCVDKKQGYFILMTGFIGTLINQFMKLAFKIPRPWVIDPEFTVVESAVPEAAGYSFPSGHTQNAVGTFGALFLNTKTKWIKWGAFAIAILVPISRMYLGVHTPWDVLAGAAVAIAILVLLAPIFSNEEKFSKIMPYLVGFVTLLAVAFYIFAVYINTNDMDVNVISARKNARTFLGCTIALIPVYILDRKVVKFETSAKWYAQIIKLVLGLGVVLVIKSLLKSPLAMLFGDGNERIVRYFLIVMFAGALWPMTFKWFSKLDIPVLNKFGDKICSLFKRDKKQSADEASE